MRLEEFLKQYKGTSIVAPATKGLKGCFGYDLDCRCVEDNCSNCSSPDTGC